MPTLHAMVNETGNRNRILEMCKFRIWFRLGIASTILYRFRPNFARGSEMWSHWRLLFVTQTGRSLPILEVCEFRFTFTFAICYRPSICLSSVCRLSSVTRAPYSGGCEFRQYFYGVCYLGHPLRCTENYMEIVPGEPLRRGVKPKRSSKI